MPSRTVEILVEGKKEEKERNKGCWLLYNREATVIDAVAGNADDDVTSDVGVSQLRLRSPRRRLRLSPGLHPIAVDAAIDDNDGPAMLSVLYRILFPGWLVARSVRYYCLSFVVVVVVLPLFVTISISI